MYRWHQVGSKPECIYIYIYKYKDIYALHAGLLPCLGEDMVHRTMTRWTFRILLLPSSQRTVIVTRNALSCPHTLVCVSIKMTEVTVDWDETEGMSSGELQYRTKNMNVLWVVFRLQTNLQDGFLSTPRRIRCVNVDSLMDSVANDYVKNKNTQSA